MPVFTVLAPVPLQDRIKPHENVQLYLAGELTADEKALLAKSARAAVVASAGRKVIGDRAQASSWMVVTLTSSKDLLPLGVVTEISSPSSLLRRARPMGDEVEIMPFSASASSGITS